MRKRITLNDDEVNTSRPLKWNRKHKIFHKKTQINLRESFKPQETLKPRQLPKIDNDKIISNLKALNRIEEKLPIKKRKSNSKGYEGNASWDYMER